ncbi:hypothetical protein KR032_007585 [Drosophila birchii]|nr:hypothetical protein KR032_007585 [Drosophila birchii]
MSDDENDNDNEDKGLPPLTSIMDDMFLKFRIISVDVEKLQRAKSQLASIQRRQTLYKLFGYDEDGSIAANDSDVWMIDSKISVGSSGDDTIDEDAGNEEMSQELCLLPFEPDRWQNYFSGFEILTTPLATDPNENRKCIELSVNVACGQGLQNYLINGVRCFLINLAHGTQHDNQSLIVKLREAEINVSKEYGFPVVSSIMAKLSPRHQYTGSLSPLILPNESGERFVNLEKGKEVILTVDRTFSDRCTEQTIYVNARFLLIDVRPYDFILIGEEIQLMVRSADMDDIKCCVAKGGALYDYMPVLFPARCNRFQVSYEELEDLTFAREVGLNVVISHIVGTPKYLDDLEQSMEVMHCDGMRLYARVLLNEIQGCDGELNWAAKRYDGFLVELAPPSIVPDIMHLCPDAECFMQMAYASQKPIIFDPRLLDEQKLRVDPAHYYYAFYYPDKYMVSCPPPKHNHYFRFLQDAIFQQIGPEALAKAPYCDRSHTGADSLAQSVVIASMQVNAVAIVVIGVTTRMAQKVAHFRPQAPIIFVSSLRSAEDYVTIYHNVTMLPFYSKQATEYKREVLLRATYAVAFLIKRKIAKQKDPIVLVYNYEEGTTFPEKYIIYKLDQRHFTAHLEKALFPTDEDIKPFTDALKTA